MNERELIVGVFYDKDGKRHEYAYTAIGFAPADVIERAYRNEREREERMRNPKNA